MSNIVTLFFPIIPMCYSDDKEDDDSEDISVAKSRIDLFSVDRNYKTDELRIEAKYALLDKDGWQLQVERPSYRSSELLDLMPKKKAEEVFKTLRYLATAIHLDMDRKVAKSPGRFNVTAIKNKLKNIKKDMIK